MRGFLRRHLSTVVVAAVTAAVTAGVPAVASHVVKYARNAGKVDGLDANQLVTAGVHTIRETTTGDPVIDDSFNYVNSNAPALSGSGGIYFIDFGFDLTNRFLSCSIDGGRVDTHDAMCAIAKSPLDVETAVVSIWDTGTQSGPAGMRPAEFSVSVTGS